MKIKENTNMVILLSRLNQHKKLIVAKLKVAKSSFFLVVVQDTFIPFTKSPKQYVKMAFQGVQ